MIIKDKVSLIKTSSACPEQYDAIYNGNVIGYLRLRNGRFTVNCPNVMGKLVYSAKIGDDLTGSFTSEDERDYELDSAIEAIRAFYMDENESKAYTMTKVRDLCHELEELETGMANLEKKFKVDPLEIYASIYIEYKTAYERVTTELQRYLKPLEEVGKK